MKEVKELIKAAGTILKQANELIPDGKPRDSIYGIPVVYCTDEELKKFIKKYDKVDALSMAYDNIGVYLCKDELEERARRNIKVVKGDK